MPSAPRPSKKATRLAYRILGVPANMRDTMNKGGYNKLFNNDRDYFPRPKYSYSVTGR